MAVSILSSISSRDIGEFDGAYDGAYDRLVVTEGLGTDVNGAIDGELLAGDVVGGPVGTAVSWQVPV